MRLGFFNSGGVAVFGDLRSMVGLEATDLEDLSAERRELCRVEGESASDLLNPLLGLLARGIAGDDLWLGISDNADLDLVDMAVEADVDAAEVRTGFIR